MKKIILQTTAILLLLAGAMISCGKEKNERLNDKDVVEQAFLVKLQSVSAAGISENISLSEWLLMKISEIENDHHGDISIVKIEIFCGEWKDRKVYFIKNNLKSCTLCDIYYDGGDLIVLDENNIEDFCTKSENWKLVYNFGEGL
jgi:hypothetical protein